MLEEVVKSVGPQVLSNMMNPAPARAGASAPSTPAPVPTQDAIDRFRARLDRIGGELELLLTTEIAMLRADMYSHQALISSTHTDDLKEEIKAVQKGMEVLPNE